MVYRRSCDATAQHWETTCAIACYTVYVLTNGAPPPLHEITTIYWKQSFTFSNTARFTYYSLLICTVRHRLAPLLRGAKRRILLRVSGLGKTGHIHLHRLHVPGYYRSAATRNSNETSVGADRTPHHHTSCVLFTLPLLISFLRRETLPPFVALARNVAPSTLHKSGCKIPTFQCLQ